MLAIHGGEPIRKKSMPPRFAIGDLEKKKVQEVFDYYEKLSLDPGYQGYFEEKYCDAFASLQGGGYADAVATGTIALYVALAALNLPKGSHVLVSPITDPGTLSAIILLGLQPKLIDTSSPRTFNVGASKVKERIDSKTSCALIVHATGQAAPIDEITEICHAKGVRVLEDCSQAHGAVLKGQRVGTFGDIAAFSTMHRKASITGSTGGVIYTKNEDLYHLVMAHSDRGKPRWKKDFDDRNPNQFLFPAFNFHANEIGCAIGLASLSRLPTTIEKRVSFLKSLTQELKTKSQVCIPSGISSSDSPFIYPIFLNPKLISCSKREFAEAVRAEGIALNSHYQYLVEEWSWVKPYLADNFSCQNAKQAINESFCLYVNENYGAQEVKDVIMSILKVENALHFCALSKGNKRVKAKIMSMS